MTKDEAMHSAKGWAKFTGEIEVIYQNLSEEYKHCSIRFWNKAMAYKAIPKSTKMIAVVSGDGTVV